MAVVFVLSGWLGVLVGSAAAGQLRDMVRDPSRSCFLTARAQGLITTGSWRPGAERELEETGLFSVTVVTAPLSDGDFSSFKPEFDQYKAVVMNLDSPDWPADLRARFENM